MLTILSPPQFTKYYLESDEICPIAAVKYMKTIAIIRFDQLLMHFNKVHL